MLKQHKSYSEKQSPTVSSIDLITLDNGVESMKVVVRDLIER